jgi:hypothetical protein
MTRYYFNENPQITLWREIAIKSQNEAMKYQQIVEERDFYKREFKRFGEFYDNKLSEFNSLPWWRKMFYKFRV